MLSPKLRAELSAVIFDSDAKPLPKRERPIDDEPTARARFTPTVAEAQLLELLPVRRFYDTQAIERLSGLSGQTVRTHLNSLEAMGFVERRAGRSLGYGGGRSASEWRRARGASDGLRRMDLKRGRQ